MKITVSKEFKDLIFPLTKQEQSILEQSILEYGVKDKLVVWQNGRNILIDGHHRWAIIKKHKIKKYQIQTLKFKNKSEAINWILENQMGRRNCTSEGMSYLRGLRYKNEKHSHGGDRKSSGQNVHLNTSDRLSKYYNVDAKTIRRDEKFCEAVNSIVEAYPTSKTQSEIKHKILTGQTSVSKKDLLELSNLPKEQICDVIDGNKYLWEARAQVNREHQEKEFEGASKIILGKNMKLYHGDCLELANKHLKDNSIDCIITDPPYIPEEIGCFDKLGQIAQRVLKPSGYCCFYTGKLNLAEVISILSKHLDYYWQIIVHHYGSCGTNFNPQALHVRKVNTFYKPILVFQKPPFKQSPKYFDDVIKGSGIQKSLHPWQQSELELLQIVEAFSNIGGKILDPFLGSGTSAAVSKKLKRKFVGFDIDKNCIDATKSRLGQQKTN